MNIFSKMALRNLWKNKRRSFSTGAAILAGFAGLCLLGGYLFRVEKYARVNSIYNNRSGHLAIYKKDGVDSFYINPRKYHLKGEEIQKLQEILSQDNEVEFTAPVLKGMGLLSNGKKSVPFVAFGIDPALEKRIEDHPQIHQWAKELLPSPTEVSFLNATGDLSEKISITKELGSLIGLQPPFNKLSPAEKEVQLAARSYEGDLNAVNANIEFRHSTGYSMLEDTSLVAPYSLFQNLYATDGATYLAVFLRPEARVHAALQRVQEKVLQAGLPVEVFSFDDDRIGLFYTGTMGFLYIMTGFFIFLIFGAIALTIVNSMTIGILERVREIGTLRALGFTDSQTAALLTLESIYLTMISIGTGFIVALGIASVVNALNLRFYPPGISEDLQFVVTPIPWVSVAVALPLFVICMLCAFFVSKRLVKKPIIQLLQQAT